MKYVIFDIDGTLTNTKQVDDHCFIQAFQKTFGIDISNQIWEDITHVTDWGITDEIVMQRLNRLPTDAEYDTMRCSLIQGLQTELKRDSKQFTEVTGASAFLNSLRDKKDIALGIATGAWEQSAIIKLGAINLDLTSICFSNSDHYRSREDITNDVIKQLRAKTKAEPTEIIYFGDGAWDYKTCKNLGIRFIGIDINTSGMLAKLGAQTVFRDYSSANKIMNSIDHLRI